MKRIIKIFIDDVTRPSGTEKAVVNLANALDEAGYSVEIVSSYSYSGRPFFDLSARVAIRHLKINFNHSPRNRLVKLVTIVSLIYKVTTSVGGEAQIVIGTNSIINSILTLLRFRRKAPIVIGSEHLDYDFTTKLVKYLRTKTYKYLDALVVLTENEKNKYSSLGLKKVFVIPNEAPEFGSTRYNLDSRTLIAVGRLTDVKGFEELIEICSDIFDDLSDWKLEIYGDGELKSKLNDLIHRRGMSNRIFLMGNVKNIYKFYSASSVYLMTSKTEGLPLVLIEAQASGLPIIAYDVSGGIREVVTDGKTGFLVPPGDRRAFKDRMYILLNNEEIRGSMNLNALRDVEKFSRSSITNRWKSLFRECGVSI